MADLDTFRQREAHARALARHYGLAPHGVELRATLPRVKGTGPGVRVVWLDSPVALVRARLVQQEQVDALLAQPSETRTAQLQWTDAAGTRWILSTNAGPRGEQYGLWLTAGYPDDAEDLLPDAAALPFTRDVEGMVRRATGRPVQFGDPRDAAGRTAQ